jgi:hypothetical protein
MMVDVVSRLQARLFDGVDEGADAIDGDLDLIVALERKGVWWNDACACEQEAAVRKGVVAKEVLDQRCRIAFQFGQCGDFGKRYLVRS